MQTSEIRGISMGKLFARITFLPTLAFNIIMEKFTSRNWYDYIDNRVILGALPFRNMAKQLVEKENVCGIVSLNETYELQWLSNMEKEWSTLGVSFLQLSTTDIFQVPSQDKLIKGVEFIENFDHKGVDGNIYVHCKAGRTRSATLVACYLMKKYQFTPEEALSLIVQKRPHVLLGPRQKEAINTYFQNLNTPT